MLDSLSRSMALAEEILGSLRLEFERGGVNGRKVNAEAKAQNTLFARASANATGQASGAPVAPTSPP